MNIEEQGIDLAALEAEQSDRAAEIVQADSGCEVNLVAGVDVSYCGNGALACAMIVVLDASTLALVEKVHFVDRPAFPYIPQFLGYREFPLVSKACAQLKSEPDLFFYDGNGRLHDRAFGAACMFGNEFGVSVIGCSKNPPRGIELIAGERGYSQEICAPSGDVIGAQLVTRTGTKPVFVSTGNHITLDTAIAQTLRFATEFRLPEPIRIADRLSRKKIAGLEREALTV